jgi:hypothetical protein
MIFAKIDEWLRIRDILAKIPQGILGKVPQGTGYFIKGPYRYDKGSRYSGRGTRVSWQNFRCRPETSQQKFRGIPT